MGTSNLQSGLMVGVGFPHANPGSILLERAPHLLSHCHEISLNPLIANKGPEHGEAGCEQHWPCLLLEFLDLSEHEHFQKHAVDFVSPALIHMIIGPHMHTQASVNSHRLLLSGTADDTPGPHCQDSRPRRPPDSILQQTETMGLSLHCWQLIRSNANFLTLQHFGSFICKTGMVLPVMT